VKRFDDEDPLPGDFGREVLIVFAIMMVAVGGVLLLALVVS
jgi:hypothetical protein